MQVHVLVQLWIHDVQCALRTKAYSTVLCTGSQRVLCPRTCFVHKRYMCKTYIAASYALGNLGFVQSADTSSKVETITQLSSVGQFRSGQSSVEDLTSPRPSEVLR